MENDKILGIVVNEDGNENDKNIWTVSFHGETYRDIFRRD